MRGRLRGLARFLEYAELAGAIVRARRADLIVVREFSTFYFALFAPLLAPWLPKTVLINAHNAQAAKRTRLQALLLNRRTSSLAGRVGEVKGRPHPHAA